MTGHRTIVDHPGSGESDPSQIDTAEAIATGSGAWLFGVHVVPALPPALGFSIRNAQEPLSEVRQRYNPPPLNRADGVRRAFETHLRDWTPNPEWHFAFGAIEATVACQARSASVTVAGPVGPDARPEQAAVDPPARIAPASGGRVLTIPADAWIDTQGATSKPLAI